MSEAKVAVLNALNAEPQSSWDIAQQVGFSWQAVQWALNRLLASGQVQREVLSGAGSRWRYGWKR